MHALLFLWSAMLIGLGGNCASALHWQELQPRSHPLDALPVPVPAKGRRKLADENSPEPQSVCEFFQSGRSDPTDCCSWGKYKLCDMSDADKWISRAAARCHDCVSSHDLCAHPRTLTIHMYLSYLDKTNPMANLLGIKAYLMTQNLLKTRFWLWTDDPSEIMTDDTKPFLELFSDVVKVKTFVWDDEIKDSPLESSPYFSNYAKLRSDFEDNLAGYSDLVRHVLLYQHGGLWIDNDVVLLRDVYPVTMQVGFQFIMRFVNPHIYFMKKRSALGKRILEQVAKLPFENSDKFVDEVINKTCRPAGYFPVVDMEQYRDFYAFCVLRLVIAAEENSGDDLDNVLFDQPIVSAFTFFNATVVAASNVRLQLMLSTCHSSRIIYMHDPLLSWTTL
ncbi:hypothetical protein ABBQ32_007236 [Trebouxia sp. C0010 RCD-2024]